MEGDTSKVELRNNPFFVISIALVIALIMSASSLVSYYNSETRKTVEQIQKNNIKDADKVLAATPSELSPEYVDSVENKITDSINSLSSDVDYNPEDLTDAALGL